MVGQGVEILGYVLKEYLRDIFGKNEIKTSELLEKTCYFDTHTSIPWDSQSLSEIIEKNKYTDTENCPFEFILELDNQKPKILDKIVQISKRREDLEEQLKNDYNKKFEEILSVAGITPEYVPIYQILPGNEAEAEKLKENKFWKGFYSRNDKISVLCSNAGLEEMLIAVHETLHHNLMSWAKSKGLNQKEKFIEEGFTEFLSWMIMGDNYTRPIPESDEEIDMQFEYRAGKEHFEQIYREHGLKATFQAYEISKEIEDLERFIYKKETKPLRN